MQLRISLTRPVSLVFGPLIGIQKYMSGSCRVGLQNEARSQSCTPGRATRLCLIRKYAKSVIVFPFDSQCFFAAAKFSTGSNRSAASTESEPRRTSVKSSSTTKTSSGSGNSGRVFLSNNTKAMFT